ncbi:hypothetical protein [Acinetobacter sp. SH20PTE14]|uniref:hypothetical protein n=1 Tax=Acinetobacter sp. SH20PTE14 TaxID=2905879 RepID=UPI001F1C8E8F|nr:hypothetical protein [Acinetobacter sp. SH20PTE14]UIJ74980.1 hypothetical protein LXF01_12200 [Acinetobacter sp. SH20PTE14]
MDQNQKKEQFSKAFVCAISAQSGLNTGTFEVDDDSVAYLLKVNVSLVSFEIHKLMFN